MRGAGVFVLSLVVVLLPVLVADVAAAMCGCMLRPAPRVGEQQAARIINKTSKVILARQGDTTVLTMANDFEGAPAEFGMVVPVPTVIGRQDVKIVDDKVFAWFEEQTAPRVVEVFEPDPCAPQMMLESTSERVAPSIAGAGAPGGLRAADFGVKVESHFFAGEYEIAVLSGKDGSGLIRWLQAFHYDIPNDAQRVLESYIKQKMMFFLARVHVKEMGTGRRHLRPIQVRYQTPKYMLPIRLGMVNAQGPQELLVFAITPQGRAEPTNYRSVRVPTGQNLPHFVKSDWTSVYGAIFDEATKREDMRVVFVEDARFLPLRRSSIRQARCSPRGRAAPSPPVCTSATTRPTSPRTSFCRAPTTRRPST